MIRAALVLVVLVGVAQGLVEAEESTTQMGSKPVLAQIPPPRPGEVEADRPAGTVDLPRYPSISPDGSLVVFSWRGDLWKVAASGGHAERLTNHPNNDLRSAWSPDGRRIAFESDRTGRSSLFVMNADGTDVCLLTDIDQSCGVPAFGVDEQGREVITFAARLEGDNYASYRPYLVSTDGGDLIRLHDAFGSYPRVSPDGERVAFTRGTARWSRRGYRGPDARDVWLFDRANESFGRLTQWEGNDGKAAWAGPDTLVYLSDRRANTDNLYRMDVGGGERTTARLTSFVGNDVQDFDVSADGSTVVLMNWDGLHVLPLDRPGAEPTLLRIRANEDEKDNFAIKDVKNTVDEAALSPDGKVMAMVAYGDVYVRHVDEKNPTRRITGTLTDEGGLFAREQQLAWSPDGLKLYFVSDRDGTESIYVATVALTRKEVREEFDKATKPPKTETEGQADSGKDQTVEEPTTQPAASDEANEPSSQPTAKEKPQAKKKRKKGKKKDDDDLPKELRPKRWHDGLKFHIESVVQSKHNDRSPSPSPDGKSLAFRRDAGDLMILDLESQELRRLVAGWDGGLSWRWSPDSRHIAYQQSDLDFNSDIFVVPADGSTPPVNITRHPDNDHNPRWSADGKILSFISERINDEYDLWRVYLDADLETYTTKELEDYYQAAAKKAKKRKPLKVERPNQEDDDEADESTGDENGDDEDKEDKDSEEDEEEEEQEEPQELDLDDAYLRLRRVTSLSGDEGNNEMTPAGDYYIFTATIGKRGLYSVKWDGKDRKRLADAVAVQHLSLTGDKIVLVRSHRAGTIEPTGKKIEYVDIEAKIRIDLQALASQKFLEMARSVGETFYHPTLKGLDWAGLTEKYHEYARHTRTGHEFNHVGMRLLGELNGSHLGVYSRDPSPPNAQSQGRLGTVHRRVADGFEVTEVVPLSPADKGPMALQAGDVITAIELRPFEPTDTVESRLTGRTGKETLVTMRRLLESGEAKELNVLITPISAGRLNGLKYRAWRRHSAEQVAEWSDGRLGYIHVEGMGQGSLDVFERDLYAAAAGKDGLIIDVRNNGGGWTADRLLASIMVRPHAYTLPRGAERSAAGHYPQDRLFIQRYTLPINMLCNEKSFSNAEILAHAFKTLERGTLVGQQTHGGVISTGGTRLIDGTWVRLPFRGWYLLDGTDMEGYGAMPDLLVPQTPEAEAANDDEQLRAAVQDLLIRLD